MKHVRILLVSTSFAAISSVAFAEPATDAGAERLTAAFQQYFSETPGLVSVTPQGETYNLTINFAPLATLVADKGANVDISPLNYTLTDLGDGTWKVVEDQSFSLNISVPDLMEYSVMLGSSVSEGVWSEELLSFTEYSAVVTDYVVKSRFQSAVDGEGAAQDSTQSYEKMMVEVSSEAASDGGVDSKATMQALGMSQNMSFPLHPLGPPMNFQVVAESQTVDYDISGMRTEPLYGLIAWFVAHPSEEAIVANQEDLRAMLKSGLPFFDNIDATGGINNLVVQSPVGEFSVEKMDFVVDVNGAVADGKFREAITISGLSIPEGLAPDWAVPLVPKDVALDFELSKFDLANPVTTLIEQFDLSEEGGSEKDQLFLQLMGGFMPDGMINIGLKDLSLSNDTYSLKAEGLIDAGMFGPPTGQAMVVAEGLDKVQEALSSAPPEVGMQVLAPLGMATSLAKPGDDGELIWEIEADQTGALLVNGNKVF